MAKYQLNTGTYTGNDNDPRAINGVGFQPDLVIIIPENTEFIYWRINNIAVTGSSIPASSSAFVADKIESFDSDGFTVDVTLNTNTVVYHWIAVEEGVGADKEFDVGAYTGDGVDDTDITGVGFQPCTVFLDGNNAQYGVWKSDQNVGEDTMYFHASGDITLNAIQSLLADGFQLGSNALVNQDTVPYGHFAFKDSDDIYCSLYTGDGNDDRNITTVGFQPDVVIIKSDSGQGAIIRTDTFIGDSSKAFLTTAATTNQIQSFLSNGFQVGTDITVNRSTPATEYRYIALQKRLVRTSTLDSDAYISKSNSETINSDAWILIIGIESIFSNVFIKQIYSDTLNSDAQIIQTYSKTLDSDAYILQTYTQTVDSDASILQDYSNTIDSDVYILQEYPKTIQSDAFVLSSEEGSIFSDTSITDTYESTINSDAYINRDKIIPHGLQRSTWWDYTRYWRSEYNYDQNRIEFYYSLDKVTWNENVNARLNEPAYNQAYGQLKWGDWSVAQNDDVSPTKLRIVYKDGNDIKVREATTGYPGTSWSWGSEYTVISGGAIQHGVPHLDHLTGGKIGVVAMKCDGGDYLAVVVFSTNSDDITSWGSSTTVSSLTNPYKNCTVAIKGCTAAHSAYAVWVEGQNIKGRYYTGAVWNSAEGIGTIIPDCLTNYRCTYGYSKDRTDDDKHYINYINYSGKSVFRYNNDVPTAINWSSETIIHDIIPGTNFIYSTLAAGNVSDEVYVAVVHETSDVRDINVYRSLDPFSSWNDWNIWANTGAVALDEIDNSLEYVGFTYQSNDILTTIFYTGFKTLDSDAFIEVLDNDKTISSDAHISRIETYTIDSDAYIFQTYDKILNSDAYIKKLDVTGSIQSNSYILIVDILNIILSDAYTKVIDNTYTINSDMQIEKEGIGSIASDAYILQVYEPGLNSLAYIEVLNNTYTLNSNAYILLTEELGINSDAYISLCGYWSETWQVINKYIRTKILNSDAYITQLYELGINSDTWISRAALTQVKQSDAWIKTINSYTKTAYTEIRSTDTDKPCVFVARNIKPIIWGVTIKGCI